jgi:hypothetical protein
MEFVKKNAKAVAIFVFAILGQAINDQIKTGQALPDTLGGWGEFLATALLAGVVVWLTGNKLDLAQILAGTKKLPVPEQRVVAEETLTKLPDPVSDSVVSGYPNWSAG